MTLRFLLIYYEIALRQLFFFYHDVNYADCFINIGAFRSPPLNVYELCDKKRIIIIKKKCENFFFSITLPSLDT